MPYPTNYTVTYNYTGFQQSQGNNAFPGTQIDADLAGLTANISSLSTFMKNVMRSDGQLNNGLVTIDALSPGLVLASMTPANAWATGAQYFKNISVVQSSKLYRAIVDHTSGVFATDLAAAKWVFVGDLTAGPPGPAGAAYGGTSATSFLIGAGSKAFTTQAGLAYVIGGYVRASSAANGANYMEGYVTAYAGTTLTLNVTAIGGGGTFADWGFSISSLVAPNIGAATGTSLVVGPTDLQASIASRITASSSTAPSILAVGQDTTHSAYLIWDYNATLTSAGARLGTFGNSNPLAIDASVLTLQSSAGAGPVRIGHNIAALGSRIDARDPTLTNNNAIYIESQRSGASVTNDTIVTVHSVNAVGNDSGSTRAAMRNLGTANGYPASTKGAFVRAIEGQALVDSSIPNDVNRVTWAMELGLHSQLAGNGIDKNVGIYLASSHQGWLPTGVRNDTGILITGEDGWVNFIRCLDPVGTLLFNVDQTGTMNNKAINTDNLAVLSLLALQGIATPATLTASVNDYVTGSATALRLSSNASWNITGIAGGLNGLVHKLINVGSFPIVLTNEDALSLAANRFRLFAHYVLRPGASLDIWYDTTLPVGQQASLLVY
jgi:hypothetical protein